MSGPTADPLIVTLALAGALGSGLIAGVFFAFSAFVMKALRHLPAAEGVAAMQTINAVIVRTWFIAVFIGTAAVCVLAAIAALFYWPTASAAWQMVGSVAYLVGSFGVTIRFNVPHNNALAQLNAATSDLEHRWADYATSWSAWNHLRTIASLFASAAFTLSLLP